MTGPTCRPETSVRNYLCSCVKPQKSKDLIYTARKPEMTHSFKFTSHYSLTPYSGLLTRVRHETEQHCTSFHKSGAFPQDTCFTANPDACSRWTTVTSVSTHRSALHITFHSVAHTPYSTAACISGSRTPHRSSKLLTQPTENTHCSDVHSTRLSQVFQSCTFAADIGRMRLTRGWRNNCTCLATPLHATDK
jgi:hypothetical protein